MAAEVQRLRRVGAVEIAGEEELRPGALILPETPDAQAMAAIADALQAAGMSARWLVRRGDWLGDAGRAFLQTPGLDVARLPVGADAAAVAVRVQEALDAGCAPVWVPAGAIGAKGERLRAARESLDLALDCGAPIIPALAWRRSDARPSAWPTAKDAPELLVRFLPEMSAGEASLEKLRMALLEAGAEAFGAEEFLQDHLGRAIMRGMRAGRSLAIWDGADRSSTSYGRLLAGAIALSRRLRALSKRARIGIALPPGRGAVLANAATILAGKVPVNLNFTASRAAAQSAIRRSGMDRIITAGAVVGKLEDFPWPPPERRILLDEEMPRLKRSAALHLALGRLLPVGLHASLIGLPKRGGAAEAALLFSSGTTGKPKGVPLSHRNILANVAQFACRLETRLGPEHAVLGCLPIFHSFGFTVTLCFPLMEGLRLATFPSPLEARALGRIVRERKCGLVLSTPTFLRGWLRRVPPEDLAGVKLVITGAEKLPASVAEAFEERFGMPPDEGYGLTETSPATNFNLPDEDVAPPAGAPLLPMRRRGSVGRLLPGLAVRFTDPETGEARRPAQGGMLWVRGANVFTGYLDDPALDAEVLRDGWFRTGDLGRMDEEGFLYIEGRVSRFSKIGGEMIPHEGVEEMAARALGLAEDDARQLVVMGRPDAAKGEALVLLIADSAGIAPQDAIQRLRQALPAAGAPALWIPRTAVAMADIPLLASGKLDLARCREIVEEHSG